MTEPPKNTPAKSNGKRDEDSVTLEHHLALIATGDPLALKRLYSATSAKLFGVILSVLRDPSESEDILQDVYLKVWLHPELYIPGIASPMAWLIRIAVNGAIDRRRKKSRVDLDDSDTVASKVVDPSPSSLDILEAKQNALMVEALIDGLNPQASAIIRLAFFQDFTYVSAGLKLGLSEGTAKAIIRRSLERLRRNSRQMLADPVPKPDLIKNNNAAKLE